ncbi:colorectal cancer-associated protein 2 [Onychostruthus taczanowskii]|uniref:colorectal cancer-associated protein 2 n=1 Tax=Onychostruthus taczanowskii TaxID=356909 RepID=UPI001B80C367|nr:colorectal cancer-associated protein 2 [Onychostruthus taczanowskii]
MSDSPSLQSVFPQILSGKPKVYQGVRVKITVKELLQQRRARQAATGSAEKVKSGGEGSHLGDLHKSSCLSCEESPGYLEQLIDSCLQSDAPSEPAFSAFQPSPHYSPDTFQPVQLCFNQGLSRDSRGPQCFPCPSTDCVEFLPPLAVPEDFFRRDRSCDICYS